MGDIIREGEYYVETDSNYTIGDIIVFSSKYCRTGFVVHRIVEIHDSYFITKGDNSSEKDPPVFFESVLGKVIL